MMVHVLTDLIRYWTEIQSYQDSDCHYAYHSIDEEFHKVVQLAAVIYFHILLHQIEKMLMWQSVGFQVTAHVTR